MTGALLQITINDKAVTRRLKRMTDGLLNLRPAFKSIGEYMVRETELRFDAQEDPEGNAWEDLAPATWRSKKHAKILTEKSNLRSRIVYRAGSESVRIGTNVVYAAVHQFGLDEQVNVSGHRRKVKSRDVKSGRKKTASGVSFVTAHLRKAHIPARPYLGANDDNRKEIVDILLKHLMESGR
jgi:phage virion morphogenesis protein